MICFKKVSHLPGAKSMLFIAGVTVLSFSSMNASATVPATGATLDNVNLTSPWNVEQIGTSGTAEKAFQFLNSGIVTEGNDIEGLILGLSDGVEMPSQPQDVLMAIPPAKSSAIVFKTASVSPMNQRTDMRGATMPGLIDVDGAYKVDREALSQIDGIFSVIPGANAAVVTFETAANFSSGDMIDARGASEHAPFVAGEYLLLNDADHQRVQLH